MIIIHTKKGCTYCDRTKVFLNSHALPYVEKIYHLEDKEYDRKKNLLVSLTNCKTFPQIFIKDKFIGGYSELISLYETLKLHDLLAEDGILLEIDF